MKAKIMVGRTEYFGSISGTIYQIEESGKTYIYLVNILNKDDIKVVHRPVKLKGQKEVECPKEVEEFHKRITMSKSEKKAIAEEEERKKESGRIENFAKALGT